MNRNFLCVFDFETGSKFANKTQVTQIAALILEPRKLEIVEGGVFNTEVCPIFDDEKATALGLDPVSDEALNITQKTKAQLLTAPSIDVVWKDFVAFISRYKVAGNSSWSNPIPVGYNITNFDMPIINRLCKQYGPYDNNYGVQNLFHPVNQVDIFFDIWRWTDNVKINDNNSKSLDSVRDWLGMSKDGAHDALNDVIDCAEIIKRFMYKYRDMYKQTKFKDALKGWTRPILKKNK